MLWRREFRNALAGYVRCGSPADATAAAICAKAEASTTENEFLVPAPAIFDLVLHRSYL
jgi:hypothetical protein